MTSPDLDFCNRILSLLPAPLPGDRIWQQYWAQGGLLNGQLHGHGMEYDPKNSYPFYEGEFKLGKRHGKGKECDYQGTSMYEGEFQNGKRHGEGIEPGGSTPIYVGEYQNGERHGTGKLYCYLDGRSTLDYEGHFEDGMKCGEGTSYCVRRSGEGCFIKGVWFKGGFMYGKKYDFKTNDLVWEGFMTGTGGYWFNGYIDKQLCEEMLGMKQLQVDLSEKTQDCTKLDQLNQQLQANLLKKTQECVELERKLEKITGELRQHEPKIRLVEQTREENRDLREKLSRMERQFCEKRN